MGGMMKGDGMTKMHKKMEQRIDMLKREAVEESLYGR